MTAQQTTRGFEMYAGRFGEKAAKRNAGRIARLDSLIAAHGAERVTLHEATDVYFRDDEYNRIHNDETIEVLGATTHNSRGRMTIVYAQIPFVDAGSDKTTLPHMA